MRGLSLGVIYWERTGGNWERGLGVMSEPEDWELCERTGGNWERTGGNWERTAWELCERTGSNA